MIMRYGRAAGRMGGVRAGGRMGGVRVASGPAGAWVAAERPGQVYISDPGVVSSLPVSSQVFRPDRIIGQPP